MDVCGLLMTWLYSMLVIELFRRICCLRAADAQDSF